MQRTRRSTVSALAGMAKCRSSVAPASPSKATPARPWASRSRVVRRALGPNSSGNRSAKVRRGQRGLRQLNRRTRRATRTRRPSKGRSAGRRRYRLCTARLARPQSGQRPPGRVPLASTWRRSGPSGVIASTRQPGMGQSSFMSRSMGTSSAHPKHRFRSVTIHTRCGRATEAMEDQWTMSGVTCWA